jgi:hypothetical protein
MTKNKFELHDKVIINNKHYFHGREGVIESISYDRDWDSVDYKIRDSSGSFFINEDHLELVK